MQLLRIAILIFVAIWAWPITVTVLGIFIIYKIIKSIEKNIDNDKRQETELAKQKAALERRNSVLASVPAVRRSLTDDRTILLSIIISTIKAHRSTLNDKFESCIDEDDYGNKFLLQGFGREINYFSEKVVLPKLQHAIDTGLTKNKHIVLILTDILHLLSDSDRFMSMVDFNNDDRVVAEKLSEKANNNSSLDYELLYSLYKYPTRMDYYLKNMTPILMNKATIEIIPDGDLKASDPIMVTPFVYLVFSIFIALYNVKSGNNNPAKTTPAKSFTGNDPYKYEEYIKGLLRSHGFATRKTRSSGDFGVDVLANKNGKTFAIQCKLYNRPVGTKAIQEIVTGRIFYKTDYAVVVSDNKFTDAARALARKSNVILVHHSKIVQKLNSIVGTVAPKNIDIISPIKSNTITDGESSEPPVSG